jgi:hypothetical protein
MYFGEYYLPTNKNFIDWFALAGGDVNTSSATLERELLAAEDSIVGKWKELFLNPQEAEKVIHSSHTHSLILSFSHSLILLFLFSLSL